MKRLSWLGITGAGVLVLVLAAGVFSAISPARAQTNDERGWLGVSLQDLDARLREAMDLDRDVQGALVNRVVPGSPADRAGIHEGDVITEFDGKRVRDVDALMAAVRDKEAGDKVLVVVHRDGESRGLSTVLGSREEAMEGRSRGRVSKEVRDRLLKQDDPRRAPRAGDLNGSDQGSRDDDEDNDADDDDDDGGNVRSWVWHNDDGPKVFRFHRRDRAPAPPDAPRPPEAPRAMVLSGGFLGVQTMALEGQLAEYFEVSAGVLVTDVVEDSPAEKAGIKAGDVITAVDGRDVETPRDLRRRIMGKDPEDAVELSIHRKGSPLTLTVTLGDRKDFSAAPEPPRDRLVFSLPDIEGLELPDLDAIEIPDVEIHGLEALKDLDLPKLDFVPKMEFRHEKLSKEQEARLREKMDELRDKLDGLRDRLRMHQGDLRIRQNEARERQQEVREIQNQLRDRIREQIARPVIRTTI